MNFAFFFLTTFLLLQSYNATLIHGVSFNRQQLFQQAVEAVQMVTGEGLWLPPASSRHDGHNIYGRVNRSPPPPKGDPEQGQRTFGRVSSTPPPPKVAPSRGQAIFGRVNSSPPPPPIVAPSRGQTIFSRVNQAPTLSKVALSMTTFEGVNQFPLPKVSPSHDETTFGRLNKSPPPPIVASSRGQTTFGRVNPSPPPPKAAPSRDQSTYTRDNPNAPPSLMEAPPHGQTTYSGLNTNSNIKKLHGGGSTPTGEAQVRRELRLLPMILE